MMLQSEKFSKLFPYFLFSIICSFVFAFRWLVLRDFSFKYPDSDQAIMWNSAIEFSKGHFYEPKFWGQSYNSMLEGLLAVPLIYLSIPVYKALPVVTSFLALFPFFLVSIICLSKNLKTQAIIVICLPLFLPIEYDFLTSLSRGFVTGIFISSLGWIAIFYKEKPWAYFCFGLFTLCGYLLNQNALLLTFPLFVFLFLNGLKQLSFYIFGGIGVVLGGFVLFLSNNFYVKNPSYSTMPVPSFKIRTELFELLFQQPNKHLNFVSPLFWNSGVLVFLLLLLLIFLFIKQKKKVLAAVVFIFTLCIIASFGLEKIYNGTDSVYFSYARMFLAIPIGFVFFVPFLNITSKWVSPLFVVVSLAFFVAKVHLLPDTISSNVDHKKEHTIAVDPIEYVNTVCQKINYYSQKNKTKLVVIYSHGYYDFIDFGCAACIDSFPKTLRPEFERRTWRLVEDKETIYANIIVVDEHQKLSHLLPLLSAKSIHYLNINGYYIISNNSLKTIDFLALLNIPVRKF